MVRTLTAADQRELAVYNSKVQQINLQMNEFRKQMNAVFGPGGSFQRSFQGPFWNNRNRPAPTTMPLLPVEETKPIPEMPFPDPPAFCYEGH
ncbi:unnamed protein product [Anisakis simplex]|uniref:Pepsin inhibitor-3-like repeated domain-containing protein n=1 Tax=Anisakis simplex TaxID=6269 RepID=A0A3P6NY06_ANISI|nr:unnamed protein product [Anisakis simplex]